MSIEDPAKAYGLFTGRFSKPLSQEFAKVVDLTPGQRVLDVGCGPGALDESGAAGAREGHLAELARDAGLKGVRASQLSVAVPFEAFEEWWEPLTLGVGSGGAYVVGLDESRRQAVGERVKEVFGPAPFTLPVSAWCVVAEVPESA